MNLDVLVLGFTPEVANQRECPAADCEVPTIMLDTSHLEERLFVEGGFVLQPGTILAQQAESTVVTEHFRVHAGETGGGIERKMRGRLGRHADQRPGGIHVEGEFRRDRFRLIAGPGASFS